MNLEVINNEIRDCDFCELIKNVGLESPIGSNGSGNIMLVNQPPDHENLYYRRHYTSLERRYIELLLKASNIDESSIYSTSVTKCPYGDDTKTNKKCLELCSTKFLLREIREVKPKVIVAVGRIPTAYFLKVGIHKVSLGKLVGQIFDYEGIPVIPIYGIQYLIQNGRDKTDQVIKVVSKINEMEDTNGFCG